MRTNSRATKNPRTPPDDERFMRRKLGGERCRRHQHEQREKIDKYGTAQQHVLADPDDDRVTHGAAGR